MLIKYAENQGRRRAVDRSRTEICFDAFTWNLDPIHGVKCINHSAVEERQHLYDEEPRPAGPRLHTRGQLMHHASLVRPLAN